MTRKQATPFGLRMPETVRSEIKALAQMKRRSMNAQIVAMLEHGLAEEKSNEKGA